MSNFLCDTPLTYLVRNVSIFVKVVKHLEIKKDSIKRISVRMGADLHAMLEEVCDEVGMSKQSFMIHCLLNELDKYCFIDKANIVESE